VADHIDDLLLRIGECGTPPEDLRDLVVTALDLGATDEEVVAAGRSLGLVALALDLTLRPPGEDDALPPAEPLLEDRESENPAKEVVTYELGLKSPLNAYGKSDQLLMVGRVPRESGPGAHAPLYFHRFEYNGGTEMSYQRTLSQLSKREQTRCGEKSRIQDEIEANLDQREGMETAALGEVTVEEVSANIQAREGIEPPPRLGFVAMNSELQGEIDANFKAATSGDYQISGVME
jgi:hypothetical protein